MTGGGSGSGATVSGHVSIILGILGICSALVVCIALRQCLTVLCPCQPIEAMCDDVVDVSFPHD